MSTSENKAKDEGLIGNEKIEEAIAALQQEPDEELRGGNQVKSTFLADLEQIFRTVLTVPEIEGVILNPWNRTMILDKSLIWIVLGEA